MAPFSPAKDWLALSLVSGLGTRTLQRLSETFGSLQELWLVPTEQLKSAGLREDVIARLRKAPETRSFQMEMRLLGEQEDLALLCPESEEFPALLLEIHSIPSVLYVQGILPQAGELCLGVVGSRSCTRYGQEQTKRLIQEIAELAPQTVIVSGLARGIDTVAHEAALEAGLRTIAVLAGGLQHIYPPENRALAQRITEQGALLSEFPLATRPVAHNFPIRNRLISGLSQGLLVTEAGVRSGAIITAVFAQQQNREVFAVPGRVDSAASGGCNRLISRQQARLVSSGAEILEDLLPDAAQPAVQLSLMQEPSTEKLSEQALTSEQRQLLLLLQDGPQELDHLHLHTGIGPQQLLGILLEMELQGWIQPLAGGHYEKNPSIEIVP